MGWSRPTATQAPAYVVEFQAQPVDKSVYNLATKVGLYGEEHPEQEVLGIAVFLRAADIPAQPNWVHAPGSPIRCISLDSFLREWLGREPDNPYVTVFAPLIIDSDAELTQRAPVLSGRRSNRRRSTQTSVRRCQRYWNSGFLNVSAVTPTRRSGPC